MNNTCTCGHGIVAHRALLGTSEDPHICFPADEMCICRKYQTSPFQQDAKPKLKMQLILLGESSLFVKVEEVDARFVAASESRYQDSRGFFISVQPNTFFSDKYIDLSGPIGRKENAGDFPSDEERSKWIKNLELALKEWSEHWEGFKTCSPFCTNHCPPPQPARVEKEELVAGIFRRNGDSLHSAPGSNFPDPDISVIHYTFY